MSEELEGIQLLREKISEYIKEFNDMPFVIVNSNTRKDIEGELDRLLFSDTTHVFGCPIAVCEALEDDIVILR